MAAIGALCVAVAAQAGQNNGLHPFTVKDFIEISYIINPAASTGIELREAQPIGVPNISPNRKYFLLETQRGVLSTNELEATLWLFNRQVLQDYISGKSSTKPAPKAIAILKATSNTPVISDVRWLADSEHVAFLGKRDSPYQQLFIANLNGTLTAATGSNSYVSQYDIKGDTIAYTTLITDERRRSTPGSENTLVAVAGKGIYSLLYPNQKSIEDLDEGSLQTYPSALHVQRNGRELPLSFTVAGKPLRLFIPMLSLSPNGKSLITVAPIHEIPVSWEGYRPAYDHDFLYLKPENQYALADENPWKTSQYVVADLETGTVSPLANAPAGRCLIYVAPTKAFWLSDSRRAIISNTFLPVDAARDEEERVRKYQAPAIAMVDILSHTIQPITYIAQSRLHEKSRYLNDVSWNEAVNELTLNYVVGGDGIEGSSSHVYGLDSGRWVETRKSHSASPNTPEPIELSIDQDLNHPAILSARLYRSVVTPFKWDPNPQLESLSLGKASLYHWQDRNDHSWTGVVVFPPNYDPKGKYPLVIQTHGYDATRFFADGQYTTGSGGRALASKGIVVLQMDENTSHIDTPDNAPDQIAGFQSAIERLAADGAVDPSRVGVIGFSFTCFHVLYAITHQPDLFAAASITDGNFMSYVQYVMSTDTNNGFQEISERTNGGMPFGAALQNWLQRSPSFNLDRAKSPLLISAFETGELLSEWEIYSGLRRLTKPVDMLWLRHENAPHILVKPLERYFSQQAAVDWFDFWLNGREDSDPAKREQYSRWRELRKLQKQDEAKTKEQSRN